jgi:hypothetical protein
VLSTKSAEDRRRRESDEEFRQWKEVDDRLVAAHFAELDQRPARQATATRPRDGGSDSEEDLFELIAREGEKAKRKVEERKAEAEAKHRVAMEAKAARPIQIASFEL